MGYQPADPQIYGSTVILEGNEEKSSVIITGASRGIGRSIAKAFAGQTNHALILIARTESGLKETKQQCQKLGDNKITYIVCDAADEESVNKIAIPEEIPQPQFLINNAGSYLFKTLVDSSLQDIYQQIRSNLFTAVNLTNRFLPDPEEAIKITYRQYLLGGFGRGTGRQRRLFRLQTCIARLHPVTSQGADENQCRGNSCKSGPDTIDLMGRFNYRSKPVN